MIWSCVVQLTAVGSVIYVFLRVSDKWSDWVLENVKSKRFWVFLAGLTPMWALMFAIVISIPPPN